MSDRPITESAPPPGQRNTSDRRAESAIRSLARRAVAAALCAVPVATGCLSDRVLEPVLPPLDELPDDLAAVTFTVEGSPTVPYVMLELREPGGFTGFVAVDGAGRPVWYFRTVGSPFGFTRRSNSNFVLLDSERGLLEVTPRGAVVRELAQQPRPGRRMHHDVTVSRRNTVLFIAEDWQPHGGELVNGEAVWEWDPSSGSVEKRWSAFDAFDPDLDRGQRSRVDDWLHANSIALDASGNILLSFHFLNQVVSISPDFDRVVWRLGGVRADIAVADAFSGQHTARATAPGRILLFDNGFERMEERYSRAAEYEIRGSTAVRVWEWRPARDNWARVISGARRLPNGNTVVGFGTPANMPPGSTGPIEVYEVDAAGRTVWHMIVGGAVSSMYRATPLHSF